MSETETRDFIRQIIHDDLESGKHSEIVTRFPPEPNGYLHVGHVMSICLNFGVAAETGGRTFLRLDDTNPGKESREYVDAIKRDVHWLGFDWEDRLTHASDYFGQLYESACRLIEMGCAYVDSLSADEIREHRGTLTEPGRNSPYRDRSVEENLDLFKRMRAGEFSDGELVLRARIDMSSPNMNMRDPALYRIRHIPHQNAGDEWCIYPMYDFAHGLSDAYEHITHSLCTLEFEDHRPLYDWFLDQLKPAHRPRQIEFSRLNLAYAVTSKRKLNTLVDEGIVTGWDDPRMPTIAGMRRRGYPVAALREFVTRAGVTKKDKLIEMGVLENCIRETLGEQAERRMAVLRPLKIVLTNYPENKVEMMEAMNHPGRPELGTRELPFSRELWIEQDDFMEDAPRKFFRLKPGGEVRLRFGYIIRCDEVVRNTAGDVVELRCSYDPDTRSGTGSSDRKVKGTIHWVSCEHAIDAQVRLYDRLFNEANPNAVDDVHSVLNPESLEIVDGKLEPALAELAAGQAVQFERLGYFCTDEKEDSAAVRVINRIVTLRDSWAKLEKQAMQNQNQVV
ncbi:MAG: glutamine--tRNA ligase/YqeY domain fusion protein [Gammaproteobacteria bacterium]|nr:glutamine--tRNA ligase/YqeY domain fusion protein [Gammaproteobacteria bacterium]MBT8110630.1 glutamine--tRNA ligase/YqeY domain fusion protein [Gammaproteobacteria bacterium]NND46759.1 glutamine--tRNA ligase/YqeY domain fusion protein [Woeseiaceae bacterium]NNL45330.1 glutamine--tRNA ligase/YqeY domain fusion protein [Woeseiaceae bacterium]